MSHEGQNV